MKHCSSHYRNISGIKYEQWTDDESVDISEERINNPDSKFIKRSGRIYREVK